ncbi:hypothetical protein Vi05172_g10899 [Venturia inaequalis]|nr:hypothetical protein Vi05172_g10899 [Venturia inaequalis]
MSGSAVLLLTIFATLMGISHAFEVTTNTIDIRCNTEVFPPSP